MAMCIRRGFPSWRGPLASVLSARSFYRGITPSKLVLLLRPCTRLASDTTMAALATTAAPVARPSRLSPASSDTDTAGTATVDVTAQVKMLEKNLSIALCEPRPKNPLLVAIVRGFVQIGELPSHGLVRELVDHFTATRDAHSSAAVLLLLKRVAPPPALAVKDALTESEDDPIEIRHMMHLCLVNALCRRRDVTLALEAVTDMERDTGRPATAKVFLSILKACAISRPPMLREVDAVWHQVEERRLSTSEGYLQQELFTARMLVYASCAGYPPFHKTSSKETSSEESQQVLQQKVDGAWDDMLSALSAGKSSESGDAAAQRDDAAITAASWIARAKAMSLCSRGPGAESHSAVSRSLEALEAYMRAGGDFSGSSDMAALAEVVRGLARSGRPEEVLGLLRSDITGIETAPSAVIGVEKSRERTVATHSALLTERLLRGLGARGAGRDAEGDPGGRRAYGLSLLEVIEGVASEARLRGRHGLEDVKSRLTATLQAILATSHFLGWDDAEVIDAATRRALDTADADAANADPGANIERHSGSGIDSDDFKKWQGPCVAALSLVAILRVSKQPKEGIAGTLDVLQDMHDRGMSPPPNLAGQLDAIVRRHGTRGQKRRAMLLLAGVLNRGVADTEEEKSKATRSLLDEANGANPDGEEGKGSEKSTRFGVGNPIGPGAGEEDDEIEAMVWKAAANSPCPREGFEDSPKQQQQRRRRLEERSASLDEASSLSEREEDENRSKTKWGARGVEQACAQAIEGRHAGDSLLQPPVESHRDLFRRVAALAERGRAHAALSALREVDGSRKKGSRVAVPYRVYTLLFRALAGGYWARDKEELELAASPSAALQWLLRGLARQGYEPNASLLNFGLEAFAVAAKSRKVQKGGEEARREVCTAALEFLKGMRTGWDGLHPPVEPSVVSYSIMIKTMCRLWMFDEAFQMLELMERNDCTPDRVTYSTLIHGLSKAGDNDGAWEVLVTMTNKGITPHPIAIDGIVDGFVRSGEVGEAISFAQHAFNQYGSPPTPAKFCRMMHAAADLDDGKHEARRAVTVAEQLWPQEWRGAGRSSHPVLGHPQLKELLRERGVLNPVGQL